MLSKETKRWLKALNIAKLLFEDQGYHYRYLEEIEDFIIKEKSIEYSGNRMILTSWEGGPNAKHDHTGKGD